MNMDLDQAYIRESPQRSTQQTQQRLSQATATNSNDYDGSDVTQLDEESFSSIKKTAVTSWAFYENTYL